MIISSKTINLFCDADLRNTNRVIGLFSKVPTIDMIERSLETERKDEEFKKEWGEKNE